MRAMARVSSPTAGAHRQIRECLQRTIEVRNAIDLEMPRRQRHDASESKRVFDAPRAAELIGDLRAGLVESARGDRIADFVDAKAEPQYDARNDPIAAADAEIAPIEQAWRRPVVATGLSGRMSDHAPIVKSIAVKRSLQRSPKRTPKSQLSLKAA